MILLALWWLSSKESASDARDPRDTSLIHGKRRKPGGVYGKPHQYACQENAMNRGASWATIHGVTKNWTQLKGNSFYLVQICKI